LQDIAEKNETLLVEGPVEAKLQDQPRAFGLRHLGVDQDIDGVANREYPGKDQKLHNES